MFGGDEDEEEDDTAELVSSVIGNAHAPEGYHILHELPSIETEDELNELIGKPILCGFEMNNVMGWFMGTVHSRNLSASDLKQTPTANFVINYKTATTKNKNLNGKVATELTARTHGPGVWWVLLGKESAGQGGSADPML